MEAKKPALAAAPHPSPSISPSPPLPGPGASTGSSEGVHIEPPLRRNWEYLAWLGGDIALGIGSGIGQFAFPLIAFAVTGSAAATGLVGLIQGAATLAGMLPGGVLADRFDRRRLRLLAGALGALLQGVLVALLITGQADLVALAAIAGLDRLQGSLLGSASDAMLKQMVTPKQLPTAVAVNEGRDAAIQLGAGPVGGALLALGLAAPAFTHAVGSAVSMICTVFLRGDYRAAPQGPRAGVLSSLREGFTWMFAQRLRVQIAVCAALVNLALNGALLTITLMLAAEGVPPAQIGLLMTGLGLAILIGAVLAPKLVATVPTGMIVIAEFSVLAFALVAVPFMPNLWLIAALIAVVGLGIPAINAAIMGYFMNITPNAMQGRAQAMTGLIAMGLMPLGPAIAGFGLEALGHPVTLGIFAAISVAGALVALLSRGLRQVPVSERWEEHARAEGYVVTGGATGP